MAGPSVYVFVTINVQRDLRGLSEPSLRETWRGRGERDEWTQLMHGLAQSAAIGLLIGTYQNISAWVFGALAIVGVAIAALVLGNAWMPAWLAETGGAVVAYNFGLAGALLLSIPRVAVSD